MKERGTTQLPCLNSRKFGRGWANTYAAFRILAKPCALLRRLECTHCVCYCGGFWGQAVPPTLCSLPPQITSPFFPNQCEFEQILDLEIRLRTAMMCLCRKGDITGKCRSKHGFLAQTEILSRCLHSLAEACRSSFDMHPWTVTLACSQCGLPQGGHHSGCVCVCVCVPAHAHMQITGMQLLRLGSDLGSSLPHTTLCSVSSLVK